MSDENKREKIKDQRYFGNFWFVFFILYFSFFILAPAAYAQRVCTMENEAETCGALGAQFRCVSNRCNLPPPIWNVAGTGLQTVGQAGSFYVRQSGVVGDRLGIGTATPSEKLELRDDTSGVARLRITETGDGQNPEIQLKYGTGDSDHWALYVDRASGDLRIWRGENRLQLQADGTLRLPTGNIELGRADATVDGLNLDSALTGVAPLSGGGITVTAPNNRMRVISLLQTCTNDQILKWNDTTSTWACAADAVGAGGAGGTLTGTGVAGQLAFWSGASSLGTTGTVPWSRIAFPETLQCAIPDQYVRAIGADGVTCGMPVAGGGGGGGGEPLYTTWYNNGSPTITGSAVINGALTVGTDIRVNSILSRTSGADTIWMGDSNDTVYVNGAISSGGCFGATVVGATAAPGVNGAQGGYRGIDGLCNTAFPGSHQCATSEVLGSIHCGAIWTDATKAVLRPTIAPLIGVNAWIANGAPSLPTPTNDCYGWTQTGVIGGQQSQGIIWSFSVQGGGGYARPCNEQNRVLCCR